MVYPAVCCPKCGSDTKVLDSRKSNRRRQCLSCNFRYSTREELVEAPKGLHQHLLELEFSLGKVAKELSSIKEKLSALEVDSNRLITVRESGLTGDILFLMDHGLDRSSVLTTLLELEQHQKTKRKG